MVLAVSQSDIAFFCQQVLLISILIDHIPAIVRCGGRTACLMHRAKLCTISRIQIGIVFPFPNVTLLGKDSANRIQKEAKACFYFLLLRCSLSYPNLNNYIEYSNIPIQIFRQIAVFIVAPYFTLSY